MTQRNSEYWDDFQLRAEETARCLADGRPVPVRRVAVFVTNRCNFRCRYCNVGFGTRDLPQDRFEEILREFGTAPIYHITGGEPSVVKWLYPFLRENGKRYRFHLNTNAFIPTPAESVRRLKVSLEGIDEAWDRMVQHPGAFGAVLRNVKAAIPLTAVSLTYTLSRMTFRASVEFARFARRELPGLYAVFFSIYKGANPEFQMSEAEAGEFFGDILPALREELDDESRALIDETLDEKRRLLQGVRFPGNEARLPCYLSMSERVVAPDGTISTCSHLYRDGIRPAGYDKHPKCLYGCNQRLVGFNEEVQALLERSRAAE